MQCKNLNFLMIRLLPMAVFCALGAAGAIIAAGIAGHIAIYITQNRYDENDTICHPEVYYPPVYNATMAEEDCNYIFL